MSTLMARGQRWCTFDWDFQRAYCPSSTTQVTGFRVAVHNVQKHAPYRHENRPQEKLLGHSVRCRATERPDSPESVAHSNSCGDPRRLDPGHRGAAATPGGSTEVREQGGSTFHRERNHECEVF